MLFLCYFCGLSALRRFLSGARLRKEDYDSRLLPASESLGDQLLLLTRQFEECRAEQELLTGQSDRWKAERQAWTKIARGSGALSAR